MMVRLRRKRMIQRKYPIAALLALSVGLVACSGKSRNRGGVTQSTVSIRATVAGDSNSYTGTQQSGTGRVAITSLDFQRVERLVNTLRSPVIATFLGTSRLAVTTAGSDGSFAFDFNPSDLPDGSVIELRFYDAGAVTASQVTNATRAVNSFQLPLENVASGVTLNLSVILTGGLTPSRERVLARYTRSDHDGATFVYDNGADTNNDGVIDDSDAALRLAFADGLLLFDRDRDGTYGDDFVRINRTPSLGQPDPNPFVNSAAFFDTNLDGRPDARGSVGGDAAVARLALSFSNSRTPTSGTETLLARVFSANTGSAYGATATFSLLGGSTGTLSSATQTAPLVAGADGALQIRIRYAAGTTIGQFVVAQVAVGNINAQAGITLVDAAGPGDLNLSTDKTSIALTGGENATISANVAALGASALRTTAVSFSTTAGQLSAGVVNTTTGVASVALSAGNQTTNGEARVTAAVQRDDGSVVTRTITVNLRARVIRVTPASATLATLTGPGAVQQLSVIDSISSADVTNSSATSYASSDASVATVSATGLVSARGPGVATITATNQGASQVVAITVTATPASISFVMDQVALPQVGDSTQLRILGNFGGPTAELTNASTGTSWSSSDPDTVSVSRNGLVRALSVGIVTITATNGGQTATATVTALGGTITQVNLSSDGTIIAVGGQNNVTLTARPTTLTGAPAPDGTVVMFSTDLGTLGSRAVVVVNGQASTTIRTSTGAVDGNLANTTATVAGFRAPITSGTVTLTFRDRFITVNPNMVTFTAVDGTQQLLVRDGLTTLDITSDAATSYATADASVAIVSTVGLISAVNNGSTTITVMNSGVAATVAVTVNATPNAIDLTPDTALLRSIATPLQLAVSGDFGAAGLRDQTLGSRGTTYVSSAPAIATVSTNGLVTAVSPGMITITATNRGQSDVSMIDVLPDTTASVMITIDKNLVATNMTDTATITATLTPVSGAGVIPDGTVVNFTTSAGALSAASATTTAGVATVTISSGTATDGTMATISATTAGFNMATLTSNSATVTFRDRFLIIAPSPITLNMIGATQAVTATDSISMADVTAMTTFTSSDTSVATVAGATITAVNNGNTTIMASNAGINGMVSVTVDAMPNAISVSPTMASLRSVGATQQLTVTGDFGAQGMLDQTAASRGTTYASSNTAIATVSAAGLVTAVTPGTVTITATNRTRTAMATIESLPDTTASVAITLSKAIVATNMTDTATITATLTPVGTTGAIPDGTVVNFTATTGVLSAASAMTTGGVATVTISSGTATDGTMSSIAATTAGFGAAVLNSNAAMLTFRDRFLMIAPSPITLNMIGATQAVTATDSISMADVTAMTTFTSADTSVATVAGATITAVNNGSTTIMASNAGINGMVSVTVDAMPNAISVSPTMASLRSVGATQQLTVTGDFGAQGMLDQTAASRGTTYLSSNPAIATVSAAGLVTAVTPGTVTITATNRTRTAMATIESLPDTTASVAITLSKAIVATNMTDTATITATLTPVGTTGAIPDGTVVNFTATTGVLSAASAMTTGGVATVTISSGTATDGTMSSIAATTAGFNAAVLTSNTAMVTFRDRFLAITPSPITLNMIGATQAVTATDSISMTDVTAMATFTSSDTSVATVAGATITAVNNGTATIMADNAGITGMVMVTVSVMPNAISVSPTMASLRSVGATQQLTVTGDFGAQGMLDQTAASRGTTYLSSNPAIATVSAAGLVTAVTPGTVTITATNRTRTAMATIESLPDTTASVAITLSKAIVATNMTDTATITATLTPVGTTGAIPDGTVVNFTATTGVLSAASAMTTGGVATVTISSGTATDGTMSSIAATTAGFGAAVLNSNTAMLTFRDNFLAITPSPISLTMIGATQALTARDGISMADVTGTTTFTSSDTSVATVAGNTVTAVNNGSAMISGNNGGVTGSVMVTVNATPNSVSVTAGATTIALMNGTIQLTVTGNFGAQGMLDLTAASRGTTYGSSNTAIATVSAAGLVTGLTPGMATITATNNGVMGTIVITVDFPTAIVVTPTPLNLNNGDTQQLSVVGNNVSMTNLTAMATYSSSNEVVAFVTNAGLVVARTAGTATVNVTVTGFPTVMVPVTVTMTTTAFRVSDVTATAGGANVTFDINIDVLAGDQPNTINFDFTLPAGVTLVSGQVGAAATAAGKQAAAPAPQGNNRFTVVIFGFTTTPIASGVLYQVTVSVPSGTAAGTSLVSILNITNSNPQAQSIPTAGIPGRLTIN
jgi:uncharacterized protein YjdB